MFLLREEIPLCTVTSTTLCCAESPIEEYSGPGGTTRVSATGGQKRPLATVKFSPDRERSLCKTPWSAGPELMGPRFTLLHICTQHKALHMVGSQKFVMNAWVKACTDQPNPGDGSPASQARP